jgi:DNA-binding NarL/FixJ family response regulator
VSAVKPQEPGKRVARGGRTTIVGASPLYRKGLSAALAEAGLDVEQTSDSSARRDGLRCVVLVGAANDQIDSYARLPSSPAVVVIEPDPSTATYALALRAGARTLLDGDAPVEIVVEAVRAALRGWTLLPSRIAQELCSKSSCRDVTRELDVWEIDCLKALAAGMTIARLADRAGYSEREMYRRLHRLYWRLDAKSRTDAIVKAARLGLVD